MAKKSVKSKKAAGSKSRTTFNMRQYSAPVVDGVERAPSRSMLRAVGFEDADFRKPQVGIASTWSMVTPCNMHIDRLAQAAADGVDAGGEDVDRQHGGQGRRDHGGGYLSGTQPCGALLVVPHLPVPKNVLHDHHGVVHEHADADD